MRVTSGTFVVAGSPLMLATARVCITATLMVYTTAERHVTIGAGVSIKPQITFRK